MATSYAINPAAYGYPSPTKPSAQVSRRASTQQDQKRVEEGDVVQGRIFWLPPKEDLPEKAVRRAHGKGAVEEGIYNHPIVVISRPSSDDRYAVHFHLITSFQGKKLNEIYGKNNEFHASRRSWYLPVAPTPDHPDANSKKAKKRFPTLDLAGGATLRWGSYVNLRHIYRVDWRYLKAYANPDAPDIHVYRFDRESMIRLLAKSRVLTNYEAGPQWQAQQPRIRIPQPQYHTQLATRDLRDAQSPKSDAGSITSEHSSLSPILQSDFGASGSTGTRNNEPPPKAPPDETESSWRFIWHMLERILHWPRTLIQRIRDWLRS